MTLAGRGGRRGASGQARRGQRWARKAASLDVAAQAGGGAGTRPGLRIAVVGRSGADVIYLYLDGFALRVRSDGKVVSAPVLGEREQVLAAIDLCAGESFAAWKGCLDDLTARGLRPPLLCVIDGNAGLRRAVGVVWPRVAVQRCCVHKLRNLERKAPKHGLAEIVRVWETMSRGRGPRRGVTAAGGR